MGTEQNKLQIKYELNTQVEAFFKDKVQTGYLTGILITNREPKYKFKTKDGKTVWKYESELSKDMIRILIK